MEKVIAKDIDGLESRLTRHGYNVKDLADLINVRPKEMRSFLMGQLAPGRSQEMKNEMLAVAARNHRRPGLI